MEHVIPANKFGDGLRYDLFRWFVGYWVGDGLSEEFEMHYTQARMHAQRIDFTINYLPYLSG